MVCNFSANVNKYINRFAHVKGIHILSKGGLIFMFVDKDDVILHSEWLLLQCSSLSTYKGVSIGFSSTSSSIMSNKASSFSLSDTGG